MADTITTIAITTSTAGEEVDSKADSETAKLQTNSRTWHTLYFAGMPAVEAAFGARKTAKHDNNLSTAEAAALLGDQGSCEPLKEIRMNLIPRKPVPKKVSTTQTIETDSSEKDAKSGISSTREEPGISPFATLTTCFGIGALAVAFLTLLVIIVCGLDE
ncbi:hypothetical protein NA57DRAFT_76583 [Rhizodiscina lignyota]|uniref:Uncharacterized protein n=1 Tax=Rhizodiscina lignyota TaxID=1504668 RepID=A0A9P4IA27_9PEZI|nr:hypothetical protein NA57DRAFT_76583 [Rhizodiscina lignyota]